RWRLLLDLYRHGCPHYICVCRNKIEARPLGDPRPFRTIQALWQSLGIRSSAVSGSSFPRLVLSFTSFISVMVLITIVRVPFRRYTMPLARTYLPTYGISFS